MSARAFAGLTLVAGLAVAGLAAAMALAPEAAEIYAPSEVTGVVSEFQLARTMEDLEDVFGRPPNPQVVTAMDAINRIDLFGFIPVYTVLLVVSALMLGGVRSWWAWAAIAAGVVGAGADVVETWAQLQVTADWAAAAQPLALIAPAHHVKYVGLALHALALAGACLVAAPRRWVIGGLGLAPMVGVAAALLGADARLFSGPVALFWIGLMVVAVRELMRRRQA